MRVQNENKLTINSIGRSCNRVRPRWRSEKFRLPLENGDKDRNIALQQATYGTLTELLQEFSTCRDLGKLSSPGIGFNVHILTGHGCVLVHPAQPNEGPTPQDAAGYIRRGWSPWTVGARMGTTVKLDTIQNMDCD